MKLFSATSKMKSEKYGELTIHWFVNSREQQTWNPADFVLAKPSTEKGYGNVHNLQCEAVEEHFTEDELEKFKEYLKRVHNDELTVKDFKQYPADKGIMPFNHIGEGGGDRVIDLKGEKDYNLPFSIRGHYYIFEHQDYPDSGDPDMDLTIDADGIIATAGGDPVGVADPSIMAETDPMKLGLSIKSIIDSMLKNKKENDEDIRDEARP